MDIPAEINCPVCGDPIPSAIYHGHRLACDGSIHVRDEPPVAAQVGANPALVAKAVMEEHYRKKYERPDERGERLSARYTREDGSRR